MTFTTSSRRIFASLLEAALCAELVAATGAPPIEERIARIERGLISPLQLEGEPVAQRTLGDAMAESGVPALALAIVDRCAVVWSGGWGALGDGESPVTGSTPFQVGSVSKTGAATVAMIMVAEGRLGLDDRVNDRLRTWKLPENDLTRETPVLVRHLLTSSAGLTRSAFLLNRGAPPPSIPAMLRGDAAGPAIVVEETPGERAVPSNAAFLLLQHVMEEVVGVPLPGLADRRLFRTLGMHDTAFEPVDEAFLNRAAGGHRGNGTAIEGKAPLVPAAPGGLWSSAEDLGRLLAALMASWHGHAGSLLPRSTARQMLSRQLGDMGLGVHVRGEADASSFQQAGGGIGSSSHIIAYPEVCQGAAVVVNSDRGRRLIAETLAAVGSEYGWPELPLRVSRTRLPAQRLKRFAGRYEYDAAPGSVMVFSVKGDTLIARSGDRPSFPIQPVSESVFVVPRSATEMRFHALGDGPSDGVTIGTAGLYGYHLSRVE
jgi:CubicO group peptidase (beta-lactamase class C family)